MNYEQHYQKTVEHYAKLALSPAWIDEARHSVKKLEKQHPDMYAGLGAAVKQRMESLKEAQKNGTSNE